MDMSEPRATRLTRSAWLEAGIAVLCTEGAGALKAEPMSRHLKTTKGSFYWHFKDVSDFHAGILTQWEDATRTELQRVRESEPNDVPRLRALAQSLADPGDDPTLSSEPAIRSWASTSPMAQSTVNGIDAERLAALSEALQGIGIGNPEVAHIIYSAAIGMAILGKQDDSQKSEAIGSLVDLVLAL